MRPKKSALLECKWFICKMILENTDGEWGNEKRKEANARYVHVQVTAVGDWHFGISGGLHGTFLRAAPRCGQGSMGIYLSTASYDGLRSKSKGCCILVFLACSI